jgi:hypothetical protein
VIVQGGPLQASLQSLCATKFYISLLQEEQAGLNLQKYKQIQLSVDSAEERAQTAENSLARVRSRSRLNVPQQRSNTGLSKSETFA